jgi:hypothetical protein
LACLYPNRRRRAGSRAWPRRRGWAGRCGRHAATDAGEVLPLPAELKYRGARRVKTQVHCISVPLLLLLKILLLNYIIDFFAKANVRFIESPTKLLWNLNRKRLRKKADICWRSCRRTAAACASCCRSTSRGLARCWRCACWVARATTPRLFPKLLLRVHPNPMYFHWWAASPRAPRRRTPSCR